ncbi:MAG: T9SS type A sorting domain-containing protein [Flavobacterium sp.]|nr:MAG: T9SS type A sorting domain-containing protein [Flavobacterium sp.]
MKTIATSWSQTNFYVDKTIGSDANNGLTVVTPWKTIQKAATMATANSIVHINAGIYYENVTVQTNGASGSPIVFTGYGGPVILDGTGTSGTTMLSISNRSNLTFENITIQNLVKSFARGISLTTASGTCNNITFRNITVKNIKWTANSTDIPQDSNNAWGMYIRGQSGAITNLLIENCSVHDNVLGYSEALSVSGNVNVFSIRNCTVYDNTNIGIHISGPSTGIGPQNGDITGNICHGNISPIALSAGIYLDGPSDITVERNSCYENPIGIEVGCEKDGATQYVNVKNNLLYNNRYSGLAVGGYTTATTGQVLYSTFRNNTLFKNNSFTSGIAEITVSKASNCVFEDNIVYSNNQDILLTMLNIQPQANNLFNYNCWFTTDGDANDLTFYCGLATYDSFSQYKSGTGQDSNSVYANPGFLNTELPTPQLALLPESLCINIGNPVLSIVGEEKDYLGNPRIVNNVVDIGANEFGFQLSAPETVKTKAQISPNPFTSQTLLTMEEPIENGSMLLYDVSGRKVRETTNLSGNEIAIERGNLEAGFYFYQLIDGGKILASGKLIAK